MSYAYTPKTLRKWGSVWNLVREYARAHKGTFTPDVFEPVVGHTPALNACREMAMRGELVLVSLGNKRKMPVYKCA